MAFDNELRVVDAGYRVVATVDTEAEAIAVLQREPIHLVLADVNLSRGGSGVEVARVASELRHSRAVRHRRVPGTMPSNMPSAA